MTQTTASTRYDLCIVGAGIAGLNAAFVSARYLAKGARVLLIDRNQQPGGMWNSTYPYVRLHQPFPFFTAGNITWKMTKHRGYLARGDEVRAHLQYCFQLISRDVDIDARWGWEYQSFVESLQDVTIDVRDPEGQPQTFTSKRLIHAAGFNVAVTPPLRLSSQRIHSTAPNLLGQAGSTLITPETPVWVIGSGKTAMDTVKMLMEGANRNICLVAGSGTYFFDRDILYPTGLRRWWAGSSTSAMYAKALRQFNGTNSDEVAVWAQSRYTISPIRDPLHNLGATLSRNETIAVRYGVNRVVRDHLDDVEDTNSGPVLVLRGGGRLPIRSGSWIINCTGYLTPRETSTEPYVSPLGRVLSINMTSTTTGVSQTAGYFLTHLMFQDSLTKVPLYALNWYKLRRQAPRAVPWVQAALLTYNLGLMCEALPESALDEQLLDTERWFPRPRRMLNRMWDRGTERATRQHCRRSLDEFSRHTGVQCAPLNTRS